MWNRPAATSVFEPLAQAHEMFWPLDFSEELLAAPAAVKLLAIAHRKIKIYFIDPASQLCIRTSPDLVAPGGRAVTCRFDQSLVRIGKAALFPPERHRVN